MMKVEYREYRDTLEALEDRFFHDGIHFHNLAAGGEPIRLGVRWASVGTVAPAEAVKFADRLLDASMAAAEFVYNDCVIEYGRTEG